MIDKQPGRRPSFLVVVDVEVDASWTVRLVAAVPQGINPLIKLLSFSVEVPPGAQPGPSARRTLRYEEIPSQADFQEVWLGASDAAISAKVSTVL